MSTYYKLRQSLLRWRQLAGCGGGSEDFQCNAVQAGLGLGFQESGWPTCVGRTSETLEDALAGRVAENNGATAPWGLMYSECMDWDPFVNTSRAMKGCISQGLPLLIVKK